MEINESEIRIIYIKNDNDKDIYFDIKAEMYGCVFEFQPKQGKILASTQVCLYICLYLYLCMSVCMYIYCEYLHVYLYT